MSVVLWGKALKIITIPLMMLSNQSLTLLEIDWKILEIALLPVQKRSQLVGLVPVYVCACFYVKTYRLLSIVLLIDLFLAVYFPLETVKCLFSLSPSFKNSP